MGISTVCIVCLAQELTNPKSILETYKDGEKYSDILLQMTGININEKHPAHPKFICDLCEKKLLDFHLFKKHCENSDEIIKFFLQNQTVGMEMELSETPQPLAVEYRKSYAQSEDSDDDKDIETLRDKGKPIIYQCKRCLAKYKNINALRNHGESHKIFQSQYCTSKFRKKTDVFRHNHNYHADENKYMCYISKEKLRTYQQLRTHVMRWHKIEEQICTKPYRHKPRPFKKCPKTVKRRCYECDKEFPCLSELYWHEKCVHPCPKNDTESSSDEEPCEFYQCEFCGKCIKDVDMFDLHRMCHPEHVEEGETLSKKAVTGLYNCFKCNVKIYQLGLYEAHMDEYHKNEFTCAVCKEFFKTREAMSDHRREHFKIQNHICRICDRRFLKDTQLRNHFKKKHPAQKFKADKLTYYKRSTSIQLMKLKK